MRHWSEGELLTVRALDIACEDCGRTRRLQRQRLVQLDEGGIKSFHQLGNKLRCSACAERDGKGRNIKIIEPKFSREAGRRA
jgi:hypothetical protein